LEPEIARAKAGESVLLFMDGVHFVQAAFLNYLWCFTQIFLRSPSGRKRWNVLGACNAISGQPYARCYENCSCRMRGNQL
jgi:hypothetical protein